MDEPWLSIITIVKDDPIGFERTIASVTAQDLDGVELVVVDSSADQQAIPSALPTEAIPPTNYGWAEPKGIYPAMNAALSIARGEYAFFLNAGDAFHDPTALDAIRKVVVDDAPDWLFGQVSFIDEAGTQTLPARFDYAQEKAALFSRGRFPPHQGTIAKTDLLRSLGGFDTSFRIAADYAMFLRLSLRADPSETTAVIADFHTGGLSSTAWRESVQEFHRARRAILLPAGWVAIQEQVNTGLQLARLALNRMLRKLIH
jgi:glycosyltransferase involved in cell wall biosynthesis